MSLNHKLNHKHRNINPRTRIRNINLEHSPTIPECGHMPHMPHMPHIYLFVSVSGLTWWTYIDDYSLDHNMCLLAEEFCRQLNIKRREQSCQT